MSKIMLHITMYTAPGKTSKDVWQQMGKKGNKYTKACALIDKTGEWGYGYGQNGEPLFTGIFFSDGTHMTYHFQGHGPEFPAGVSEGDPETVHVMGHFEGDGVFALIVRVPRLHLDFQPDR